jgi:hypothetical protein
MALQLLSRERVPHMFRHDAESFIWLFLWVCGGSDGSAKEVLVAPYKVWRRLDMIACKKGRGDFLSAVGLDVSASFCSTGEMFPSGWIFSAPSGYKKARVNVHEKLSSAGGRGSVP